MDDDLRNTVLTVTIAMIALSTIFVALRFISRAIVVGIVGLNDYLILVAWVITFGMSFSICYGTKMGLGLHVYDIPPEWQPDLNKAVYSFSVLYNPALTATKTSILVFYLSLMARDRIFRRATYFALGIVNASGIALTLLNIFRCRPIKAAFSYPIPQDAICMDLVSLYLSSIPANVITDLAVLLLPVPIITRMNLPLKQKMILLVTFGAGVFVVGVDVVRTTYLHGASVDIFESGTESYAGKDSARMHNDFTSYFSKSFMWSAIGANLGIVCACVPTLKPLVTRILPKLIRSSEPLSQAETLRNSNDHSRMKSYDSKNQHFPKPLPPTPAANAKWRQRSQASKGSEAQKMGLAEFLMTEQNEPEATEPTRNLTDINPEKTHTPFFDFVKLGHSKSMLQMSVRESIPVIFGVTVLFFLWGFTYALLDLLNCQFIWIIQTEEERVLGLHAIYFLGYLVGPILGRFLLKKGSFKLTFVVGFFTYACGVLLFWPSAALTSYAAFMVSNFIAGFGLAVVETAAFPFIALCGPPEYSEMRLNISLGFHSLGTALAPILAKNVLFHPGTDIPTMLYVQWAYLVIAFFYVLVAAVFQYMPIPDATDEELVHVASERRAANSARVGGFRVIWLTLSMAIATQFFYVGGQQAVNYNFVKLLLTMKPDASPFPYQSISRVIFAVGRFAAAGAQRFVKPRYILLFLYTGLVVSVILSMHLQAKGGMAVLFLIYFFESGVFGLTFASSLRGMGHNTKTAAALLTSATSGGGAFTFFQKAAESIRGIQFSFIVEAVIFSFCLLFPIYLILVPAAKRQVDPRLETPNKAKSIPEQEADESVFPSTETILGCFQRSQIRDQQPRGRGLVHSLVVWPSAESTRYRRYSADIRSSRRHQPVPYSWRSAVGSYLKRRDDQSQSDV